jgi:hypothetical protein
VNAQWELEEEMHERGNMTSTSTACTLDYLSDPLGYNSRYFNDNRETDYHVTGTEYDFPRVNRGSCCDCEHYDDFGAYNFRSQDDGIPPFYHAHPCL